MATPPPDEGELKTYGEHLEDLRRVLIRSSIALLLTSLAAFAFVKQIMSVINWPVSGILGDEGIKLSVLGPSEGLMIALKASLIAGLVVASPFIFHQFAWFFWPGLTHGEKKLAGPVFFSGLFFFLLGMFFCYFVVLRLCFTFLWGFTRRIGLDPAWTIGNYFSFFATMLIAFGAGFELPVVAVLLAKLDLLTSRTLVRYWAHATVGIFAAAAVFTPPDVASQLLLAFPMVGLYGLSVLAVRMVEKARKPADDDRRLDRDGSV